MAEVREGEAWWEMDDEEVTRTDWETIAEQRPRDAYIFLYSQCVRGEAEERKLDHSPSAK